MKVVRKFKCQGLREVKCVESVFGHMRHCPVSNVVTKGAQSQEVLICWLNDGVLMLRIDYRDQSFHLMDCAQRVLEPRVRCRGIHEVHNTKLPNPA